MEVGWQKGKLGVQLAYTKLLNRPNYSMLNSNVQYDNRYQYEGGNPLLQPTTKRDIDLNIMYSWLKFTVGYGRRKDMRLNFGEIYQEGTEITFWTNRNFDKLETYTASFTAAPKLGKYQPTLTFSYWQQKFNTKLYGLSRNSNKAQFEINLRNWFIIDKLTKAMLYIHYSNSYDYGFTRYNKTFNVNTRIQRDFFKGNLTCAIFANDIFHNARKRWTGYYPKTTMSKDAYTYTRYVGVSFSLHINAMRGRYKGKGTGSAEKRRL